MRIITQKGIKIESAPMDITFKQNELWTKGVMIYKGMDYEEKFKKMCDFEKVGINIINYESC